MQKNLNTLNLELGKDLVTTPKKKIFDWELDRSIQSQFTDSYKFGPGNKLNLSAFLELSDNQSFGARIKSEKLINQ